jgi:hypothetical protein
MAIAGEVLDSLVMMTLHFRAAGAGFKDFRPQCKNVLRRIAGITVHTTIQGEGRRTRHTFERGEIEFKAEGVIPERVNLRPQIQSLLACR